MSKFKMVTETQIQSPRASVTQWPSSLLPTSGLTGAAGHRCGNGVAEVVGYRKMREFIPADLPITANPVVRSTPGPCSWSLRSG